jgi:hypothetical protein
MEKNQDVLMTSLSTKSYTCKECGQEFLSWLVFDNHVNKHLQKHLDDFAPKIPEKKTPWEALSNIPEGLNRDLLKVFEKYRLGDKSVLCLWRNGHLTTALREKSRELELQTRLKEWLQE